MNDDHETALLHGRPLESAHQRYPNREAAKRDLFAYIEGYYNRQRLHSALGYISPEQTELQAA